MPRFGRWFHQVFECLRVPPGWLIGASILVAVASLSFGVAGVVVGIIKLGYFEELFSRLSLGPDGSIGIYRTDGNLISRFPLRDRDIGFNIGRNAQMFQKQPGNQYVTTAITDGVRRLYSSRRIGEFPLVVAVGTSIDSIYAPWRKQAWVFGIVGLLLALATIGLATFAATANPASRVIQ